MTVDVQNDINALSCIGNVSPSVLGYNYIEACSRWTGTSVACPIVIRDISVPYCGYRCAENACPILLLHADINLLPSPSCKLECFRCISVTSTAYVYYNIRTCSGETCPTSKSSATCFMWRHVHHTGPRVPIVAPTCSVAHMFDPITLDWVCWLGSGITCINCVVIRNCLNLGRLSTYFCGNVCTTAQAIILNGSAINDMTEEKFITGGRWWACTSMCLPYTYDVYSCIRS